MPRSALAKHADLVKALKAANKTTPFGDRHAGHAARDSPRGSTQCAWGGNTGWLQAGDQGHCYAIRMGDERRPAIPEPVKRAVRQRCGFGCVICGMPLYDYHHKLEWANVRRHVSEEITLLCTQHHREATNGLLPTAVIERADQNPFNRGQGATSPLALWFDAQVPPVISLPGITFTCVTDKRRPTWMWPLYIDGAKPFGFTLEEGGLLLNVHVCDSRNRPVVMVQDSVLRLASDLWDIRFVGQTLTIQEQAQSFLLEMEFHPPNQVNVNRYHGHALGGVIDIQGGLINISGGRLPSLTNIGFDGCRGDGNIGVLLGDKPPEMTAAFVIGRIG
jgi:hypothetical protein